MSETKGNPTYECCKCGESYAITELTIDSGVLSVFMSTPMVQSVGCCPRQTLHPCSDGGFGIGNITGFIPEEVAKVLSDAKEGAKVLS